MNPTRRHLLQGLAAGCALPALRAHAATVVDKQTHIIIGFPTGGTGDVMARVLADNLRGSYAPSVIVENRPGARGVPAAHAMTAGDTDGSYLYMSPNALSTLWPFVYNKLPYDAMRDFIPVGNVARLEFALAVNADLDVHTVADYIAWARKDPSKAMYGTLGVGSLPEFIGYGFAQAAGIRITPVPYRGSGPGVVDLIGGQTPSWLGPLGDVTTQLKTGRIRLLATTGSKRSRHAPDVPTFTEAGYPDVVWLEHWGVFVRRGTPDAVIRQLNTTLVKAAHTPEYGEALTNLGYDPVFSTPQEHAESIRRDRERIGKLVAASGFRPED